MHAASNTSIDNDRDAALREKDGDGKRWFFSVFTSQLTSSSPLHCCNLRILRRTARMGVYNYTVEVRPTRRVGQCAYTLLRALRRLHSRVVLCLLSLYNNNRCHFIKIIIVGRCCSMCGIIQLRILHFRMALPRQYPITRPAQLPSAEREIFEPPQLVGNAAA